MENTYFNNSLINKPLDFIEKCLNINSKKKIVTNDNIQIFLNNNLKTILSNHYLILLFKKYNYNIITHDNYIKYMNIICKNLYVLKLFIKEGNNVNEDNNQGEGLPLIYACLNSNTNVVNYLIKKKADVNKLNNCRGWNALHYMCYSDTKNSLDIIRILLNCNPSLVNVCTRDGSSPLYLAKPHIYASKNILDLLSEHNALLIKRNYIELKVEQYNKLVTDIEVIKNKIKYTNTRNRQLCNRLKLCRKKLKKRSNNKNKNNNKK